MKCEIQWIGRDGRPTPDENEAVAMAHHHEAIWLIPAGGLDNRIAGYNPDVIQGSFPICAEHLAWAEDRRARMAASGWTFTSIAIEEAK